METLPVKKLVCLALSIILLISPLAVMAQTEDNDLEALLADFETFESEDGFGSIKYPSEWIIEEDTDGAITLGSNEDVFTRLDDPDGSPEAGDLAVSVIFFPTEFVGLLGISGESVADYATSFGIYLLGETTGNEIDEVEVEIAETILLSEDVEIGVLPFRTGKAEGRIIIYEISPEILVWIVVAGHPSAVENNEAQVYAMVSSISYSGTADDLMGAFE
jgi:hypothetical protein